MQTVLQSGRAKADLAVLRGSDQLSSPSESTYSLPTLLDHGWNYQVVDDRMLALPTAVVRGKVLAPDGPAYRGLVVNQVTRLRVDTTEKLISYARRGLPVVLFNSDITRVYGTDQPGENDAALAAALATLKATPNVYVVSGTDQSALLAALESAGLAPDASYDAPGLITLERSSAGRTAYYLYNSAVATVTADVTLRGTGRPEQLDAWTGTSTPIGLYTSGKNTITTPVTLAAHEATVITVGGPEILHATSVSGGSIHGRSLRAESPGTYTVTLSDGRTRTVEVPSVPAAADLSGGWRLDLESWGPGSGAALPTVPKKATVSFGASALGAWSGLPATADQLAALGVTSMALVSGIGTYTTTVDLPAGWRRGADGAVLAFAHGNGDEVVAVTVNGARIGAVNQVTDAVDVGPYLRAGANTLRVEVDSNLGNRVGRAAQSYGLTGVTFTPYTDTSVAAGRR